MMRGRWRRRTSATQAAVDEGPFVSFTDLIIGILFMLLILVVALMLRQQALVPKPPPTPPAPVKAEPVPKTAPELPAFRLGIVFNVYQRAAEGGAGWVYSRTVRVFRSPSGECINTVWQRSNLSTAWAPPTGEADIPTTAQRDELRSFKPCGLSASGDHWESATEAGSLKRLNPDLYSGSVVLHQQEGDVRLDMQYRVLGVYDDYFR